MRDRNYIVRATLVNPYCEAEFDDLQKDAPFDVKHDGVNLAVTYEAGGNVDAIAHTLSLLRDLEEWGVEAAEIRIAGEKS